MLSFRIDLFEELLHLQFVQCFREIPLNSGQRQRLRRIAINDCFGGEKPKKNLQRHYDQLDRRRGKPGAFAFGKIFAHNWQSHIARLSDFSLRSAPSREFAQRSVSGKLIILRKTPFDCQKTNERIDCFLH